jgi:hypothetical protein
MKTPFRFTEETLNNFDAIFNYVGTLEDGLWVYENPFNNNKTFFVQVGYGRVLYVNGWCPDGMSFVEIVNKLKKFNN